MSKYFARTRLALLLILLAWQQPGLAEVSALQQAVDANRPEQVMSLLQAGQPVEARVEFTLYSAMGKTSVPLLIWAVNQGHTELLAWLLAKGQDPNLQEVHGRTAIDAAIYAEQAACFRLLFEAPGFRHEGDTDLLRKAANQGALPIVSYLLQKGLGQTLNANEAREDMLLSLIKAAEQGDLNTLELLMTLDLDLDRPLNGKWALHQAVVHQQLESVVFLLAHGADPLQRDWSERTAMDYALAAGHPGLIEQLRGSEARQQLKQELAEAILKGNSALAIAALERGADPNSRLRLSNSNDTITLMVWAARFGNLKLTQLLLSRGGDPNLAQGKAGITPLMQAAASQQPALVRLLVQHGAKAELQDALGANALAYAAAQGHLELVEELIRLGSTDQQALSAAIAANHLAVVRSLLNQRERLQISDTRLREQLWPAAAHASPELLDLLLETQPDFDLNSRDAEGMSLLFRALSRANFANFSWLLAHGADPDQPDAQGQSPLAALLGDYYVTIPEQGLAMRIDGILAQKGQTVAQYVDELIAHGAGQDLVSAQALISADRSRGPLPQALLDKVIGRLGLNQKDALGRSLLHQAVAGWSPGLVRYLLARKLPLEALDGQGNTVLLSLLSENMIQTSDWIDDHWAGPETKRALLEATAQALLAARPNLNARNRKGQTLIEQLFDAYADEMVFFDKGMIPDVRNGALFKLSLWLLQAGAAPPRQLQRVSQVLLRDIEQMSGYQDHEIHALRAQLIDELLRKGLKLDGRIRAWRNGFKPVSAG